MDRLGSDGQLLLEVSLAVQSDGGWVWSYLKASRLTGLVPGLWWLDQMGLTRHLSPCGLSTQLGLLCSMEPQGSQPCYMVAGCFQNECSKNHAQKLKGFLWPNIAHSRVLFCHILLSKLLRPAQKQRQN